MKTQIITPEKRVFNGDVVVLTIPTKDGYISIMDNHIPLVSAISPGVITIKTIKDQIVLENEGGVLETHNNEVVVMLTKCHKKN
ncbi:MAG: ATP synthase epsilon chain [Parcubacteria group bacterium ADurb.Bin247]|jgi:F-type H+-transporting ATPase subunit epsilon|nr:MAG: ATP synthase epsilon chain [Parcubacteria group bacterium ADurb.Bin247]HQB84967.1 F0F1 ATP synthase subunit epsilon [Candidatus Pacearchaeota archaeon]